MDKVKAIKTETEELLKKLVDKFEVEVELLGEAYSIAIKTEEASTVIGRRGATIRSIQKILEVILYKKFGEPVTILVNVNDFRERQRERLEKLAEEYVEKVKEEQKPYYLENLNSFERRIIHEYIGSNYPALTTYSIDEGKEKKLVIEEKKEEKDDNENEESKVNG